MTDDKPTPPATSSGPIAREIAEWLHAIRNGWTQSVDEPLSCGWRRFYGFAGSSIWAFGFMLVLSRDPRFSNFTVLGVPPEPSLLIVTGLVLSAWVGWLIAYTKRNVGPIRLFLDGLLLPAAIATIIGLSARQIQSVREEPRASSESQPVPLTRPQGSNQSSQDTSGAERSEEGGNELPN